MLTGVCRLGAAILGTAISGTTMKLHRNSAIALFVLLLACLLPSFVHAQAWKEAVGYNALLAEKGAALENGT